MILFNYTGITTGNGNNIHVHVHVHFGDYTAILPSTASAERKPSRQHNTLHNNAAYNMYDSPHDLPSLLDYFVPLEG